MNEAENTFRALKDQTPLVTRFLCHFGFHRWTKYEELSEEKRGPWSYGIQKRHCADCGLHSEKVIWKH